MYNITMKPGDHVLFSSENNIGYFFTTKPIQGTVTEVFKDKSFTLKTEEDSITFKLDPGRGVWLLINNKRTYHYSPHPKRKRALIEIIDSIIDGTCGALFILFLFIVIKDMCTTLFSPLFK